MNDIDKIAVEAARDLRLVAERHSCRADSAQDKD